MQYCSKCGNKIDEEMSFCPKCGAALKAEQPVVEAPSPAPYRAEKAEKGEKREKQEKEERQEKKEKTEKQEKREYGYLGPLIGGFILIALGLTFYLSLTQVVETTALWAFFFIIIGVIIIVGAIYAAMTASKRQPMP